jgi:hypothetical protein
MVMNDRTRLHRRIPFNKRPEALVELSQQFLAKAGYSSQFADSDYGFMVNSDLLRYIGSDKTAGRWKYLDAQAILFWYRQSPRPLESAIVSNTELNPPMQFSEEVRVALDTEGRLVSLRAVPPQWAESDTAAAAEPDWKVLFTAAGLDITKWTRAKAQWSPASYADTRTAWQGELPNQPGTPMRIEAAVFQGKAVSFDIIRPWTRAAQMESAQQRAGERFATAFSYVFLIALLASALFFALRNLRLGRGDRRNATRLALFIMGITIVSWALSTHHFKTYWELANFGILVSISLFLSCSLWVLYIAIEPFVRRRWPQVLISWTRLLSGD